MSEISKKRFGIAVYVISGGKLQTRILKALRRQFLSRREMASRNIQIELDAEHASGKGVRAIDGKAISFVPFTAASVSYGAVN